MVPALRIELRTDAYKATVLPLNYAGAPAYAFGSSIHVDYF